MRPCVRAAFSPGRPEAVAPSLKDLHAQLSREFPRREVWAPRLAKVVNLLSHKLLPGVLRMP